VSIVLNTDQNQSDDEIVPLASVKSDTAKSSFFKQIYTGTVDKAKSLLGRKKFGKSTVPLD
jgi:hypothetical protein